MASSPVGKLGTRADWVNPPTIAMGVYFLLMAFVGLLIPDDILKTNPDARQFSNFMASIVPQIDRITALNIKPDVNRFYFSVLWAVSPILFVIGLWHTWDGRKRNYPMWTMPFTTVPVYIIICLLFIIWSQQLWAVDSKMRLSRGFFENSFGRGLFGQFLFVFGGVLIAAANAVWILSWLTGYIPRNIAKTNAEGQNNV